MELRRDEDLGEKKIGVCGIEIGGITDQSLGSKNKRVGDEGAL